MNLHLGCGSRYLGGWTNVDLYAEKVDVRADLRTVEFEPGSAATIRMVHTIEHFTQAEGIQILRKCAKWLAPGGTLELETPDRRKCLMAIKDGAGPVGAKGLLGGRSKNKPEWDQYVERWSRSTRARRDVRHYRIHPKWNLPGEVHLCVWMGEELAEVLRGFGLVPQIQEPQHHGKRSWRDTRVVGVKP